MDKKQIYVQLMLGTDQRKSHIVTAEADTQVNEDFSMKFNPLQISERELYIEVWIKKDLTVGEDDEDDEDDEFIGGVAIEV